MPPTETRVAVDTHALLWWFGDRRRLGRQAANTLDAATAILVPSIVFWEIGMLAERNRITLDRPVQQWAHDIVASGDVTDTPLDATVAAMATNLDGFHGDPADQLIAATAITHRVALVSKDHQIRTWANQMGQLTTIW